jgi:uncharacterized protein YndB with AHSA1/START domain
MNRTLTVAPVRKSVRVSAPPARAFEVFTAGIGRWWPLTHSIGTVPMKEAVIEPRAGGRWFQRNQDGSECDVGKVLLWEPPGRLVLGWQLSPQFKYDPSVTSEVEVRFLADGATGTLVELEHRNLERYGEQGPTVRGAVDAPNGWTAILNLYAAAAAK